MDIVAEQRLVENEVRKPVYFDRVKLLDMVMRIVPSAFFLLVVLMRLTELYVFIVNDHTAENALTLKFAAGLVSRASTLCFLGLMSVLFLIRLGPIGKAKGIVPRILAIAGTFLMALVTFFPRAHLSTTETVIASLLSLVGTGISVYVLAYLGRSFSLMAEARRLVTTGPYRVLRHPLYIFEGLASLGVLIHFLSFYTIAIFVVFGLIQFQRMKNEEAVLEMVFPEYQEYKLKTARLIPGIY